jgi:hypothetical protein
MRCSLMLDKSNAFVSAVFNLVPAGPGEFCTASLLPLQSDSEGFTPTLISAPCRADYPEALHDVLSNSNSNPELVVSAHSAIHNLTVTYKWQQAATFAPEHECPSPCIGAPAR